jgi:CBS domain-containing protein
MQEIPTIREFMSKPLITLRAEDDIFHALDTLVSKGYSGAPVVDNEGRLLGLLTEKDCLRTVSSSVYNEGLQGGKVSDYMSPIKATVDVRMDLFAVAHVFLQSHFTLLPVLDQDKLIGRISRRDVLRGIREWQRRHLEGRARSLKELEVSQKRPSSIEEMQRLVGSLKREQVAEVFRKDR